MNPRNGGRFQPGEPSACRPIEKGEDKRRVSPKPPLSPFPKKEPLRAPHRKSAFLNQAAGELADHRQNPATDEEDDDNQRHWRQVQTTHQRNIGADLFHHRLGHIAQNPYQRVERIGVHPAENRNRDDNKGINQQQGVDDSDSRKQGIPKGVLC